MGTLDGIFNELQHFLVHMTSYYHKIQFTLETEKQQSTFLRHFSNKPRKTLNLQGIQKAYTHQPIPQADHHSTK